MFLKKFRAFKNSVFLKIPCFLIFVQDKKRVFFFSNILFVNVYIVYKNKSFFSNILFVNVYIVYKNESFFSNILFVKQCLLYDSLTLVVFHRVANGGIP